MNYKTFVYLVILIFSCNSPLNKRQIILNSLNKEWELKNVIIKGEKITAKENQKIFIVFYKNGRYDLYWKKNGRRIPNTFSDNIFIPEWKIDSSDSIKITDFKGLKLKSLTISKFIFIHNKITYEFELNKSTL